MTDSLNTQTDIPQQNIRNPVTKNLWTIVALLVLAILLTVSYKLKDILKPSVTLSAELDSSCDLRSGDCTSELPGGGKVTFSITPRDIPILKPLKLSVNLEGVNASKVNVDFIGIDMDMGYNRPSLQSKAEGQFAGETIIPVCVRSRMEWEARVLIQTEKGLLMAPFRFHTTK